MGTSTATTTPTTTPTPTITPTPTNTPLPTTLTLAVEGASSQIGVGKTTVLTLALWQAARGLSGIDVVVRISTGEVAEITSVKMPDYGLAQVSALPAADAQIQAADVNGIITATTDRQVLASFVVKGKSTGSTIVFLQVNSMDDENGNSMFPVRQSFSISVD